MSAIKVRPPKSQVSSLNDARKEISQVESWWDWERLGQKGSLSHGELSGWLIVIYYLLTSPSHFVIVPLTETDKQRVNRLIDKRVNL